MTAANRNILISALPVERQGWNFDHNGYAAESDYEDDGKELSDPSKDWSQPLIRIHTSDRKDYLAENNLTELYGWTTRFAPDDQYEGEGEFIIWVTYEEGFHAVEVSPVELYNVKEGVSFGHTVYRLNYDGEGFSTYGSYEEAAAFLNNNFGQVITEEEAETRFVEAYLNDPLEFPASAPSNPLEYPPLAMTTTTTELEVIVSAYMKARDILNKRKEEEGNDP